MAQSNLIRETHMARILQIATRLFLEQTMGTGRKAGNIATHYPNIMVAIPNAFVQWEKEYRDYCAQWSDPEYEVNAMVEHMRTEMTLAFQFPINYIR